MAAFDFLECERRLQQGIKTIAPCASVHSSVALPVDTDQAGENLPGPKEILPTKDGKKEQPELSLGRHLTSEQREEISTDLQDSITGPVSMTAPASDKEAVCYQGEIASVLEDSGFDVEIDNTKKTSPEQKIASGVQMTIADGTIRPRHAYRIVQAFRRAGLAIATRINSRRQNNTLYITVGPNDTPALASPMIRTAAPWPWKSLAGVLVNWIAKFSAGPRRRTK